MGLIRPALRRGGDRRRGPSAYGDPRVTVAVLQDRAGPPTGRGPRKERLGRRMRALRHAMARCKPLPRAPRRVAGMIAPARLRAAAGAVLLVGLALADAALAQFAPPGRPGERRLEETRPELPEFRPAPAPDLELPPVPPPAARPPLSSGVQVFVNAIRLTGNTVFSDQELAPIVAPYLGRAITTEELLDLRDALTRATSRPATSTRAR